MRLFFQDILKFDDAMSNRKMGPFRLYQLKSESSTKAGTEF